MIRSALCFVLLVFAVTASVLRGVEPYFADTFENVVPNPNLEGYGDFVIADGSIHLKTGDPNDLDRRYLRTALADYNTRDFVYELTFTSSSNTITFVGLGLGDGTGVAYNEPGQSVTFRIHSPDVAGGKVVVNTNEGELEIGSIHSSGPHQARIEKRGAKVTFSLDINYDGVFKADMFHTYADIKSIGPFLTADNSHLFFGSGSPGTNFDDFAAFPPIGIHPFRRGDTNGDGNVNIGDPVHALNYLFLGGDLSCLDASDIDDDGAINISDAIGLLGYLFLGTLAPLPPFKQCAQDPSDDRLSCDEFPSCP